MKLWFWRHRTSDFEEQWPQVREQMSELCDCSSLWPREGFQAAVQRVQTTHPSVETESSELTEGKRWSWEFKETKAGMI